jgi:hypothetical protein
MTLITKEGLLVAIFLSILPLIILYGLQALLPPWPEQEHGAIHTVPASTV